MQVTPAELRAALDQPPWMRRGDFAARNPAFLWFRTSFHTPFLPAAARDTAHHSSASCCLSRFGSSHVSGTQLKGASATSASRAGTGSSRRGGTARKHLGKTLPLV